jgi:hypothetical protein
LCWVSIFIRLLLSYLYKSIFFFHVAVRTRSSHRLHFRFEIQIKQCKKRLLDYYCLFYVLVTFRALPRASQYLLITIPGLGATCACPQISYSLISNCYSRSSGTPWPRRYMGASRLLVDRLVVSFSHRVSNHFSHSGPYLTYLPRSSERIAPVVGQEDLRSSSCSPKRTGHHNVHFIPTR